jgi:NTP pyrophosphatase (non-canonical NTP hydrolase)
MNEQILGEEIATIHTKIDDALFVESWNDMQKKVNQTAHDKGWYEKPAENGTRLMLMVSEIAEAMEADRKDLQDDKIPEFLGLEAELADCVIRIMDFSEQNNLRLAEAILAKAAFNKSRPHRHGGKKY